MRFSVLGEVGAVGGSGSAALGGRLRRLLAGLLAHRNGEVGRDDLIAIVWGEYSEPVNAEATSMRELSRYDRSICISSIHEFGGSEHPPRAKRERLEPRVFPGQDQEGGGFSRSL